MKRREVLTALLEQLKLITQENGYLTNAGQFAQYWKTVSQDYQGAAFVSFEDYESQAIKKNRLHNTLNIPVQATAFCQPEETLQTIEDLLEDLYKNLRTNNWWQEIRDITKVEIAGYEKMVYEEGSIACQAVVNLVIEFRED